jgi:hypothetical protein
MVSTQHILRFIDSGRGVRRPPLVGMRFLHERRIATRISPNTVGPKHLVNFLISHFTGSQRTTPRCSVALRVFTPSGSPAVRVRYGKLLFR